jgi:hypothetical protein
MPSSQILVLLGDAGPVRNVAAHAVAGVDAAVPAAQAEIFAVPAWAVGLVGAIVVLSGVLYFFWRVRSARRGPRAPTSVRPATGKIR